MRTTKRVFEREIFSNDSINVSTGLFVAHVLTMSDDRRIRELDNKSVVERVDIVYLSCWDQVKSHDFIYESFALDFLQLRRDFDLIAENLLLLTLIDA